MVRTSYLGLLCANVLGGRATVSDGDGTTCMAPHLDLVSQSISGTVSLSESGSMNLTIPPTSVAEKIDFEQFNIHTTSSSSSNFTDPTTNVTMTIKAEMVQIINLAERHAISYTEVNNPLTGNITKRCTLIPFPDQLPDAAVLSLMFKARMLAAECGGSDGTYDTWKMSHSYDGPIPDGILPVPTAGLIVNGTENVEITTSQDSLLHSVHNGMNVGVMAGSSTLYSLDLSEDFSISSAEAGGPSDEDLDPEQFDVECTTPEGFNVNTFFTSSTPGVFQKHALATLQAALRTQHELIVV